MLESATPLTLKFSSVQAFKKSCLTTSRKIQEQCSKACAEKIDCNRAAGYGKHTPILFCLSFYQISFNSMLDVNSIEVVKV
jgi:hypothetical protein